MKRLKAAGVWTAVLLAAGLLALAGCGDAGGTPAELLTGAAIEEPFEPRVDAITSSGFTIVASSAAVVAEPNPGHQVAQHGVSTTTNGPVSWRDPGELVFTGLRAEETYYIWARAAETSEYAAGKALMADVDPVETKAEGEDASVRGSWEPAPTFNASGTNFTILPATPVVSGQTVEYAMSNSNTTVPTTNWISTPPLRFNLSRLGDDPTETQYYFWARTIASGSDPAGTPLYKEVTLPGPTLTSVNWTASGAGQSGNSAILSITDGFTMDPEIPALVIQYGLGTSATATEGIVWSPTAPVDGSLTIGGLAAQTTYYLYARTRQTNNFAAGPALLYNNTFTVTTTTSNTSSATSLLRQLEAIKPSSASILDSDPNTVVLIQNVDLNANITIPQGVKLNITNTKKLDAKYFNITGGGTIEVEGELTVNEYNVNVTIAVNNRGKYTSTAGQGSQAVIAESNAIMKVSSGIMTVKVTNNKFEWELAGAAEISSDQTLRLNPSDTFTLKDNSTFTIPGPSTPPAGNALDSAGKIEVNKGSTLKIPANYNFADGLNSTGAQIIIHAGAMLEQEPATPPPSNPKFIIHDIAEKTKTTPGEEAIFYLDPSKAAQIVIQLQQAVNEDGTPKVENGKPVYDTKYTLSGAGSAAEVGAKTAGATFKNILAVNSTLTVPTGTQLTIGHSGALNIPSSGTVDVNGTLKIAEKSTTEDPGTLDLGGRVNVNSGGVLSIDGGSIVKGGGTIDIKGGTIYAPTKFEEFKTSTVKLNLDRNSRFMIGGGNAVFMGVESDPPPTPPPGDVFVYAASQTGITNPNIAITMTKPTGKDVSYPVVTFNANIDVISSYTIPENHEYTVPSARELLLKASCTNLRIEGKLTITGKWTGEQNSGASRSSTGVITGNGTFGPGLKDIQATPPGP